MNEKNIKINLVYEIYNYKYLINFNSKIMKYFNFILYICKYYEKK